jgi:hypothetical protein
MRDEHNWFRVAVVWFALVGIALVGAACGSGTATHLPDAGAPDAPIGDGPPPTLTRIEVTPAHPSLPTGTMQPLTATGVFSNSTTRDLTSQVSWTSDAAAHATVSGAGIVAGVAPGTATITATQAGISGATTVTVTDAVLTSIGLTPTAPSVPAGRSVQFTVTGTFSDATTLDVTEQATWASDTPGVATVSDTGGSRGLVEAHAAGTAMIAATLGGMTAETRLTVTSAVLASIAVTPLDPSVPVGTTAQLTATGTFSDTTTLDLTEQVTWASQAEASATVSNAAGSRGLATTLALGTARITATLDGIAGGTTVTVTDAVLVSIAVTPPVPSVAAGQTQPFTATGTFSDASVRDLTDQVIWASSEPNVAQISNAAGSHGVATAGSATGTTQITATLAGVSGATTLTVTSAVLVSISVTPVAPSVPAGRTQVLTATATFSDASVLDVTRQATWASSAPGIAPVSNAVDTRGLATALVPGTAQITATLAGVTGGTTLTVTDAVLQSIEVAPLAAGVAAGRSQAFTATGSFSDQTTRDLTDQVTWASTLPAVAQVSNAAGSRGVATGISPGIARITATLGGANGGASLTVTSAALVSIAVAPAAPSLPAGLTQAFTATGTFSDATIKDLTTQVTWSSSAPAVAPISNAAGSRGVATGLVAGTTQITAALSGVTGATTLTVTSAVLVSLAVAPVDPSVPLGRTQPFTATGTFSDASVRDVTGQATWSSSAPAVAPISNATGSRGVATATAIGTAQITAVLAGMTAGSTMTVTDAVLASIAVAPARAAIAVNKTQAFTATGTFTDGAVRDLTDQVTWSSSVPAAAQVSNAAGSRGVATGLAAGAPSIMATLAGVTGAAPLIVIDFDRIDFLFGYCDAESGAIGVTVAGLEQALPPVGFSPPFGFSSVRWLDGAGNPLSIDAPVSILDGSFDGLRCIPETEFLNNFMLHDPMTLVLIGPSATVTVNFQAVWLAPQSAFTFAEIGAQIQP